LIQVFVGEIKHKITLSRICGLTVCVTRRWAGVDSVWEQEKPEARKMLDAKHAAREASPPSTAPMKMTGDHFIPENGGLYKMWSQIVGFTCKKRNLSPFSISVLRTRCWAAIYFVQ
jgi:hypothetical protein